MTWTIPNILTVLRLLAAPGVAVMFLYFHRPWADWFALTLFIVAAITDYFDGYLARAWKQESRFGAMLDPIADKAMVVVAIMVLTALCLTLVVFFLVLPRIRTVLHTRYPRLQLARSIYLMCATILFFFGISNIGLAEASAIMSTNPLFITLGAAVFLASADADYVLAQTLNVDGGNWMS